MKRLIEWLNRIISKNKAMKRWKRVVTVLAAILTFATTYALILPAITVERDKAEDVGGMYLEQTADTDDMLEDNALEPLSVIIAADNENAVSFSYADDEIEATAIFSTDEEIPEGAELVVNPVIPESEEYADLSSRSAALLDKEFIYDVTTCSFYDFALVYDNVDVTPETGLVDIQITFHNNTVEHVDDMLFAGRYARPASEEGGFVAMSADDRAIDTVEAADELISVNPDESQVIELTDGVITSISLKGTDLSQSDSLVGVLAGNVDEEIKAAAAETDAFVPYYEDVEGENSPSVSAEVDTEEAAQVVKTLEYTGSDYSVILTYDGTSKIPEGAVLTASEIDQNTELYRTYLEETKRAMGLKNEDTLPRLAARFFDIKIMVGEEEFIPKSGVSVEITYAEPLAENPDSEVNAVHFADKNVDPEVIEANTAEVQDDGTATVEFTAESFSVYGVIYTVDFYWEVNGKTYECSLPGGGFASFEHLVEVLGIANSDTQEDVADADSAASEEADDLSDVNVSDKTRKFTSYVQSIKFSDPELVWVGKVESPATVGKLKEANGIECKYSEDLTEEQIAEINAQKVEAGDWALISMQPFSSEESLTVTMQNGNQFVIRVTDAQISANVLTADGKTFEITITFDADAKIPAGAKLVAEELEPGSDEYFQYMGRTWAEVNKDYLEQKKQIKEGALYEDDIKDIRPVNIDESRFFNVAFMFDGKEIEPEAPVKVDIRLVEGLSNDAEVPINGIVHFPKVKDPDGKKTDKTGTELIEKFKSEKDENGNIVEYSYELDSFSVMGAYRGQETEEYGFSAQNPSVTLPKRSALRADGPTPTPTLAPLQASKTLTPNTLEDSDQEDGTYTLSLSVKGDAIESEKYSKTNVLIVMDRSTSMRLNVTGAGVPYTGNYVTGKTYYGIVDDQMQTLNYNSGQWTYTTGEDYPWTPWDDRETHIYDGTVYVDGSRLEAEQAALDELIKALTDKNTTKNPKAVEVSVRSFASERGSELTDEPIMYSGGQHGNWQTGTETDWLSTYETTGDLYKAVHNPSMNNGTNWEDALIYAKEIADDKHRREPDEEMYIIFLTDGMPTAVYGEDCGTNGYGAHHYIDDYGRTVDGGNVYAYNFARDGLACDDYTYLSTTTQTNRETGGIEYPTQKIVGEGYKLYNIFTFNQGEEEVGYLRRLTNFAYNGNDDADPTTSDVRNYYTAANDIASLKQSFDKIFKAINDSLGHGDVKIVDGLTTDAMHTNIADGQADGIRYKVEDAQGNLEYTVTATGDSADPTVTFTVGDNNYTYNPTADNNKVEKITTFTDTTTEDDGETITKTEVTTTVTVGGGKTTVSTKTVVSTSTDNGATYAITDSTATEPVVYNTEHAEGVTIPDGAKTYYSLTNDGKNYRMALVETVTDDKGTPDESDDERTLTWDLSPIGILKKDYTYTAEFVVWPNQAAYDYCAGLNNVAKKEAEEEGGEQGEEEESAWNDDFEWKDEIAVPVKDKNDNILYYKGGVADYPSIVKYPGHDDIPDTYSVLSNTDQDVYYSDVHATSTNDVITGVDKVEHHDELEKPDPMPLTFTKTFLEKEWSAKRNLALLAEVLYYPDGTPTKFVAKFDIYKGKDYKTDDTVKPYMELSLGWDGEKYAWEDTKLKRVMYNGNPVYLGTRWASDFSIATGLMLSDVNHVIALGLDPEDYPTAEYGDKTYYILERGHDYYVEEKGELGYEFDFVTPVFHPMIVDGELMNVIFEEELGEVEPAGDEPGGDEPGGDEPGGDEPGGDELGGDEPGDEPSEEPNYMGPYHISEITPAPGGSGKLKVENKLRAYINIEKKIVDEDGRTPLPDDDTEFTYDVELISPMDPGPFEGTHIPWYGINDLYYHTYEVEVDPDTGEEIGTPVITYYQADVTNRTNEAPHKSHTLKLTTESGEVYDAWRTDDDGNDDESLLFDEDDASPQWIAYRQDEETVVRLQLRGNVLEREAVVDEVTGEPVINEETGEPEFSTSRVSLTIPIKQGQKLSIANVPLETKYTVTERQQTGYNIVNIRKEIQNGDKVESRKVYTGLYGITDKVVADRDNNLIFTNKVHSTDITVKKLDEKNKLLPGATFTLTKVDQGTPAGEGENPVNEWVVPAQGQADTGVYKFTGLPDGTYTLVETTAPAGYKRIGADTANEGVVATFTIFNGQIVDEEDVEDDLVIPNSGEVELSKGTLTFTVDNKNLTGPGSFTVRKQWLDAYDNPDAPGADSVTVLLKRRVKTPPRKTLRVVVRINNKQISKEKTWDITNESADVQWTDNGQYSGNNNRVSWEVSDAAVSVNSTTSSGYNANKPASFRISGLQNAASNTITVTFTYGKNVNWNDFVNQSGFETYITNTTISISGTGNEIPESEDIVPDPTWTDVRLTLNAANRWAVTKTCGGTESNHAGFDYPATDDDGNPYYYYIVEETSQGTNSLPGYEPPAYSENNDPGITQGILTASNKKTETGSLAVKKLIAFANASDNGKMALANGKYNFTVKDQNDTVVKHIQFRYQNGLVSYKVSDTEISFDDNEGFRWTYTEGAIVENLVPGTYTVTETDHQLENSNYDMQLVDIKVDEDEDIPFNVSAGTTTLTVTAGDVPTAVTSYTNMLIPLMEVPVDKTWHWSDSDKEHFENKEIVSWSATFKLQYREEYYSGTPDAAQNVQSLWGYVMDGDSEKQIEISKQYDPDDPDASEENIAVSGTGTFGKLPKFKVHANGSIYRLKYALDETEYTIVYKDGSSHWEKYGQHGDFDEHYAPAYDEDAYHEGDSIIVDNAPSSERLQKSIDLGIHKLWEDEDGNVLPVPPDNSYSARFRLKRYYHEEYLEVPDSGSLGLIKVTLDLGNGETMTLEVPSGAPVYFTADMRTDENANVSLVFNRTSPSESPGTVELLYPNPGHYASTDEAVSFVVSEAIRPTADETWTFDPDASSSADIISKYVLGGIDGVRLATFDHADHHGNPQEFPYDVTGEILDPTFEEEFDLDSANEWAKNFKELPQIVEILTKTTKDGVEHTYLTTKVYSYYFEEIACNPAEYYPVYRDHNNAEVRYGDELSRVEIDGLTIDTINKPVPNTLIYKIDEKDIDIDLDQEDIEDYLLEGAQFDVIKYTDNTFREIDPDWGDEGRRTAVLGDDGKDGKFVVDGLVPGFYEIDETDRPYGYVKAAVNPRFKVALNAQTEKMEIIDLSENDAVRIENDFQGTGDNVYIYGNALGAALPNAGGPGTRLLTILGLTLIAGAGLMLWRRRRTI